MKFFVIGKRKNNIEQEKFAEYADEEAKKAVALFKEEFIRELYSIKGGKGACMIVEARSEEEILLKLSDLPFVKNNYLDIMENILLVINIILAAILVILVLLQKSEGGALGIGVSQDNFMFARSAGNFMTKATAIVATLFIICSLSLTILSRGDAPESNSVLDKIEEKTDDTPQLPE